MNRDDYLPGDNTVKPLPRWKYYYWVSPPFPPDMRPSWSYLWFGFRHKLPQQLAWDTMSIFSAPLDAWVTQHPWCITRHTTYNIMSTLYPATAHSDSNAIHDVIQIVTPHNQWCITQDDGKLKYTFESRYPNLSDVFRHLLPSPPLVFFYIPIISVN